MVEEDRIVAFIDVLGFSEVMESDDQARRQTAIQLLQRVAGYGAKHGVRTNNLGLGVQVILDAEVTTFSDNIVLSVPVTGVTYQGAGGEMIEPASSFARQLVQSLISIFWQGLHLGLLFRGAVTTGRLFHDKNVVAGEALVRAVRMERDTRYPRIELSADLIEKTDENGRPILEDFVRDVAVVESDGRYFLNTLGFHMGVWWDYNHFRSGRPGGTWDDVREALGNIRWHIRAQIERIRNSVENAADDASRNQWAEALAKWEWFSAEFEAAQEHEQWQAVWSAPSAR